MTVTIYGKDKRLPYAAEYLSRALADTNKSAVLLPVPSTRDGVHTVGCDLTLEEVALALSGGDIIVGYEIPRPIREKIAERGAVLVDLAHSEDYLSGNAELTAIGTLGRILAEGITAPPDMTVGIIGCGRIGQRLLHLFSMLGARVRAFTSRRELAKDLCMLGISGISSLSLDTDVGTESFSGLDVLINTAPASLIPRTAAPLLAGTRVIELASGSNISDGIVYERFASVPAEMYPKSAGAVFSDAVLRILREK